MFDPGAFTGVIILTGHYGVGKTTLALNLCVDMARAGKQVTCVDMDIVNPYFRSSDYENILREAGVELISPLFAGTSLDSPGLSGRIIGAIEAARTQENKVVLIDAGGDDAGAKALGRFGATIEAGPYELIYVVNRYRNLTQTPEDALEVLREIEAVSHLRATGIINNSHLKQETTPEVTESSLVFGEEVATLAGLPCLAHTVPDTDEFASCAEAVEATYASRLYPVKAFVTTPWGS